jgi:hypothetical protein
MKMNKTVMFSALLAVMTLVNVCTASAQVKRFQGEWKNADPQGQGLVKLQISVQRGIIEVHAWSACPPEPCDLGNSEGYVVTTIHWWNDTPSTLLVNYELPFAEKLLVIGLQKKVLSAKMFTHFTDDSHRTDYVERAFFHR